MSVRIATKDRRAEGEVRGIQSEQGKRKSGRVEVNGWKRMEQARKGGRYGGWELESEEGMEGRASERASERAREGESKGAREEARTGARGGGREAVRRIGLRPMLHLPRAALTDQLYQREAPTCVRAARNRACRVALCASARRRASATRRRT